MVCFKVELFLAAVEAERCGGGFTDVSCTAGEDLYLDTDSFHCPYFAFLLPHLEHACSSVRVPFLFSPFRALPDAPRPRPAAASLLQQLVWLVTPQLPASCFFIIIPFFLHRKSSLHNFLRVRSYIFSVSKRKTVTKSPCI